MINIVEPRKASLEDLAVVNGRPAFADMLHVGRPNTGDVDAFLQRARAALDRHWLTNNGPFVQDLEKRLAERIGVRHGLALANGTQAIELMLRAADLKGEVIVPSYTFVATAHAALWMGLTPVFADVDAASHNLTAETVAPLINSRTEAIVAVHLWGRGDGARGLEELARSRGLKLFFDAAHAFGSGFEGRALGSFGLASSFSFHATKCFHTFEGGAVTTNDDALFERIRLFRNFGFAGYDNVVSLGTNSKMNEISAAMGLTLLDGFEAIVARNAENYRNYRRGLAGVPGLSVIDYPDGEKCNFQYVVLEVQESSVGLSRDELVEVLQAENVMARRYFFPGCHRMEPYRSLPAYRDVRLPVTERLANSILCLPTGTSVGTQDIALIVQVIRTACAGAARVRAALARQGERRRP